MRASESKRTELACNGGSAPMPPRFCALPPGLAVERRGELRSIPANPGRRAGAQVASPQSLTLRSGATSIADSKH